MCDECGCNDHKPENKEPQKVFEIDKPVTIVNDVIAAQIKEFLKEKEILCINLMGSPGSGKTTVLEGISRYIDPHEMAVIQGDLESDIDKKRLEGSGIFAHQINTHSGCHLNASMINKALMGMDMLNKKYLIIENVGNLVCPARVDIGQHLNILVSSTTEGSDKPKKYPIMFLDSKLLIISKYDLKDAVGFDEAQYLKDVSNINGKVKIIKTSLKDPDSFKDIAGFIEHERAHLTGKGHRH